MKLHIHLSGSDPEGRGTSVREFEIDAASEKTLLDVLALQGIFLDSSCGGRGKCGRCRVNLIQGRFLIGDEEIVVSESRPRPALACVTRVMGDSARIEIPAASRIEASGRIIDDFVLGDFEIDPPVKKVLLDIPEPGMDNHTAEDEQIVEQLTKRLSVSPIGISLPVLRKLPGVLERGGRRLAATLGRVGDAWSVLDLEPRDGSEAFYGLAVDIGTTTVVAALVDLQTGGIIGRSSLYNRQITVAEDVISRISAVHSRREIDMLKSLVVDETVNPLIRHLCLEHGIEHRNIIRAVLSGNTIMAHMLMGIDPRGIGHAPFQPVVRSPEPFAPAAVGLDISSAGRVDVLPAVSGYIGGDIVSDIHVSGMGGDRGLSVLIDIGTNGEIVLSDNGILTACSTAAGPAFEGFGLHHGRRAGKGAVEKVRIDGNGNVDIEVIGGGPASGICGTGVIDFIAEGRRAGLIGSRGRFDENRLRGFGLEHFVQEDGKRIRAAVLADGDLSAVDEPIIISELDVSKIILAKAAVLAGLTILLKTRGKDWRDIERLVLAGGFARHIDLGNAAAIGLIPPVPEDRIEVIGNGSLAGAFLTLVEPTASREMAAIASRIEVVELNMRPEFQSCFVESLFFPPP